ncbi:hypothetical protein WJX72_010192 [[Myrmecia] bisecta]|uniref:Uncharacterized protein n=1 Tax=[Myrmecia] bisecta TaxID=41462 RepID=A0AAW1NZF4_9CHLO
MDSLGLTPYELERAARVETNQEVLARLKVAQLASQVALGVQQTSQDGRSQSYGVSKAHRRSKGSLKRKQVAGDESGTAPIRISLRKRVSDWESESSQSSLDLQSVAQRTSSQQQAGAGRKAYKGGDDKRGGRPVTWIGGGGLDPESLVGLGVPKLRAIFLEVFGHHTASNNGAWLRRKLCEAPDSTYGQGRSAHVRARDATAAIWTTGTVRNITQAEARLLAEHANRPVQFIDLNRPAPQGHAAPDLASATATPLVTPTKHLGHKVVGKPRAATKLTYNAGGEGGKSWRAGGGKVPPSCPPSPPARRLLRRSDLREPGCLVGRRVDLFWPDDDTWWPATIAQLDSAKCTVVYETGEMEELNVEEVVRDGIMGIGWLPASGSASSADASAGEGHSSAQAPAYNMPTPGLAEADLDLQSLMNVHDAINNGSGLMDACDSSSLPGNDFKVSLEELADTAPSGPRLEDSAGAKFGTQDWADNMLTNVARDAQAAGGGLQLRRIQPGRVTRTGASWSAERSLDQAEFGDVASDFSYAPSAGSATFELKLGILAPLSLTPGLGGPALSPLGFGGPDGLAGLFTGPPQSLYSQMPMLDVQSLWPEGADFGESQVTEAFDF